MTADNAVWPEYLMIRDTGLHDDSGGLGQRIYTTAGAGYAKVKYVRADIAERDAAEIVRLRGEVAALLEDPDEAELVYRCGDPDSDAIAPAEAKGESDACNCPAGISKPDPEKHAPNCLVRSLPCRTLVNPFDTPQPAGGEAVAWAMTDYQSDGPITVLTSDRAAAEHWASAGVHVEPLYTTPPAAQVQPVCPPELIEWMQARDILPDEPFTDLDLIAALDNHEAELLATHPAAGDKVRELLREAGDTVEASTVEDGISENRRRYRVELAARIKAALAQPQSGGDA